MFLTAIFIPSDLSKYLCVVKKEREREKMTLERRKKINRKIVLVPSRSCISSFLPEILQIMIKISKFLCISYLKHPIFLI